MGLSSRLIPAGSQDMEVIKEQNTYWDYYWMENSYGRLVPVAVVHAQDALKRGYIHTDRKVVTDRPEDNVRENMEVVETDPMRLMAHATTKMAQVAEAMVGGKADNKVDNKIVSEKPEKKHWKIVQKEEREAAERKEAERKEVERKAKVGNILNLE